MFNEITDCQICNCALSGIVIDGRTKMGPWAYMCEQCHTEQGVGLGLGKGQKFQKIDGKWVKIAG